MLVLDEPMSGMDPEAQRAFKEEASGWRRYSPHIEPPTGHGGEVLHEARVGIISGGRLIAEGDLDELRRRAGEEATLEDVFLKLVESS